MQRAWNFSSYELEVIGTIQHIINRMATNSFIIKGWAVAVLGILLKRTAADSGAAPGVIVASWIGIGVLTLGILIRAVRGNVYR